MTSSGGIFRTTNSAFFAAAVALLTLAVFGLYNWYLAWMPLVATSTVPGEVVTATCVEAVATGGNRRSTTLWATPVLSYNYSVGGTKYQGQRWARRTDAAFPSMIGCEAYVASLLQDRKALVHFESARPAHAVLDDRTSAPMIELLFLGLSAICAYLGIVFRKRGTIAKG